MRMDNHEILVSSVSDTKSDSFADCHRLYDDICRVRRARSACPLSLGARRSAAFDSFFQEHLCFGVGGCTGGNQVKDAFCIFKLSCKIHELKRTGHHGIVDGCSVKKKLFQVFCQVSGVGEIVLDIIDDPIGTPKVVPIVMQDLRATLLQILDEQMVATMQSGKVLDGDARFAISLADIVDTSMAFSRIDVEEDGKMGRGQSGDHLLPDGQVIFETFRGDGSITAAIFCEDPVRIDGSIKDNRLSCLQGVEDAVNVGSVSLP